LAGLCRVVQEAPGQKGPLVNLRLKALLGLGEAPGQKGPWPKRAPGEFEA